jgi:hypothetical protein
MMIPNADGVVHEQSPLETLDMYHEPAATIGQLFADQARLKTLMTAVLGVLAVAGINVVPGLDDQLVTILNILVPLVLSVLGYGALTTQARQQAITTRGHVYAPATVERIVTSPGASREAVVRQAIDALEGADDVDATGVR